MIAFVGSVFSPYYHFAGRKQPEDHVCINVALYSVEGHRWAMTERGRSALKRKTNNFTVGPSSLTWDGNALIVNFAELSLPRPPAQWLPKPINGRIRLEVEALNDVSFNLDPLGCHHWQPIAPLASILVECNHFPDGGWRGEGYLDTNHGNEPLEARFTRWDWSRGRDSAGNGLILYDAELRGGGKKQLALRFPKEGGIQEIALPPRQSLKRGFWGVKRSVPGDAPDSSFIKMEMEDSPFYTRSLISNSVGGETLDMMHETFDGDRLRKSFVKLMLPVRMPRKPKWTNQTS